jgi:hydrogenase maturation protease
VTSVMTEASGDFRESSKILIAGIGNVFLSDDGFGVEVVKRLEERKAWPDVVCADVGVAGMHLAYELLEGYDVLILVDTMQRGEAPGTISILEVDPNGDQAEWRGSMDGHSVDPVATLSLLQELGGEIPSTFVVACEPQYLGEGMGLSPIVQEALDCAEEAINGLIKKLRATGSKRRQVSHEVSEMNATAAIRSI